MSVVMSANASGHVIYSNDMNKSNHVNRPSHPSQLLPLSTSQSPSARGYPNTFSPVHEGGTFEFDRVLKSSSVQKRRKRTKAWDTVRLVLRPDRLSIYKDEEETKLRHQIHLVDITAATLRRARKPNGDQDALFGVFTPSRNFHLEAASKTEAKAWVDLIRREAGIEESGKDTMGSSNDDDRLVRRFGRGVSFKSRALGSLQTARAPFEAAHSSSPSSPFGVVNTLPISIHRPYFDESDASGNELGSHSDLSEPQLFGSLRDLSLSSRHELSSSQPTRAGAILHDVKEQDELPRRWHQERSNTNSFYKMGTGPYEERVIWQSNIACLKTRGAVRQWKKYWAVLRPKHLALYKTQEEYAALLILPLASILDAVETDAVTKGKEFCLQVITDERSYRFCCPNEDELTRFLGALKSILSKKQQR